jgi:hypothetical protein
MKVTFLEGMQGLVVQFTTGKSEIEEIDRVTQMFRDHGNHLRG